jgi:hypothetical protein
MVGIKHAEVMAFHEKAGPRQVDFDLPFLKFSLSFMAGRCAERPPRVVVGDGFLPPPRCKANVREALAVFAVVSGRWSQ